MPSKPTKKSKQTPAPSNSSTTTTSSPPTQPPNWPALKPTVPPSDLSLTSLLPDQIYVIRNLFPASLCRTLVSFLASLDLTTTPGKPKRDEAVRVNDRFQVHDERFAERLWKETGLGEVVNRSTDDDGYEEEGVGQDTWGGEVLGLNPNIRIYRYTPGQFFAQHYDDSVSLQFTPSSSEKSPKPVPAKTTWTLLIYLTTCSGGETVFYPEDQPATSKGSKKASAAKASVEPVEVGMEVGMALLHRHGERCLLHEGREVKEGVKWVVRSDLVVRR